MSQPWPLGPPPARRRVLRRTPQTTPTEVRLAQMELQVARLADLMLKVDRLLLRARARDQDPGRGERMARMTWVLEHGRAAVLRVADE